MSQVSNINYSTRIYAEIDDTVPTKNVYSRTIRNLKIPDNRKDAIEKALGAKTEGDFYDGAWKCIVSITLAVIRCG